MAKRQKPRGRSPEAIKRAAKRQQERSGVLYLRIPRALHRALKQAAQADHRDLTDWMRLNLPRLLEDQQNERRLYHTDYPGDKLTLFGVGESSDPPTGEKS